MFITYSRWWVCPQCYGEILWSYEQMAEAGNPICNECDIEMELTDERVCPADLTDQETKTSFGVVPLENLNG